MTALPTKDREGINLICDQCGQQLPGISSTLRNWDVVWALVSKHGWVGSPLAIGPHQCPRCSSAVPVGPPAEHIEEAARNPRWNASTRLVRGVAVIELHGDLDVLVADSLREVLAAACQGDGHVVLDLADVRLIDSTALGVLVRAHQVLKRKGRRLCLAAPSRFIIVALRTMRLHPVFPIFDNHEQAVDWATVNGR
ncbi:MAG TPA: STAS domain-containing protein [Micromonosporaceae bacterium]